MLSHHPLRHAHHPHSARDRFLNVPIRRLILGHEELQIVLPSKIVNDTLDLDPAVGRIYVSASRHHAPLSQDGPPQLHISLECMLGVVCVNVNEGGLLVRVHCSVLEIVHERI